MTRNLNFKIPLIRRLVFCCFLFIPSLSSAVTDSAAISVDQTILVAQGKVKSFDQKEQFILLKTSKGERMNIVLNWDTALVGYSSLQEIQQEQGIKIWYTVEVGKNIAIKIERKLEVGC